MKPDAATLMARETMEAPAVASQMIEGNKAALARISEQLATRPPSVIVTCGRGSSDHAASYGKYLIEALSGVPVASAAPSIASIYRTPIRTRDAFMIAVSQSGRSPDLLATATAYQKAGAFVLALVNDTNSPLAETADMVLPLGAGVEGSVAATKSCIAALVGFASLVSAWTKDEKLCRALEQLPLALQSSLDLDWSPLGQSLIAASRMLVLGRGFSFGIAQEAALKLKETCAIQAEPFSSAEARHGPMRIIETGYPVLGFAASDAAGADVRSAMTDFERWGAVTLRAGQEGSLPTLPGHPALEPIMMLAAFYKAVEQLARLRGMDPDAPPHLEKVTRTL